MILQTSLFSGSQPFVIDKPIRLIELFAGIGAQAKALSNIGANFEHYRICEIDKYAVITYNAIHGTNFEPSDITKITASDLGIVNTDKYCYIITYSFPCQDLSKAGKQKGMFKGSSTRSGLLWEVERLLDEVNVHGKLPQILLMENVPEIHGKKNILNFAKWIEKLENLGYYNYWKDLNAKDYGVPQNRNRCFMVSLLGDYFFMFPNGKPLKLKLKDMLESKVDEYYYISKEQACKIRNSIFKQRSIVKGELMKTLLARDYKEPPYVEIENNIHIPIIFDGFNARIRSDQQTVGTLTKSCGQADSRNGIAIIECPLSSPDVIQKPRGNNGGGITRKETCPTITKSAFEQNVLIGVCEPSPAIIEDFYKSREPRKYEDISPTLRSERDGLKVVEPTAYDEQNQYARVEGCIGTLTTDGSSPKHNSRVIEPSYQIRKLTPKECWRLMGFADEDFDKAKWYSKEVSKKILAKCKHKSKRKMSHDGRVERISNNQLYKQAGNSICVNILEAIFKKLKKE